MRNFLLLVIGLSSPSILMAAIFSWTDQSGNTIYGDTPPQGVTAKSIDPPKLTILEGFGQRYDAPRVVTSSKPKSSDTEETSTETAQYESIKVIAPKQGQAIRANDGDVSFAISVSPKLKSGDNVIFTLDGAEVQRGALTVANMTNLDRGGHSLTVSVVDNTSSTLITSETINFSVLRASALKKAAFNPYSSE